MKRSLFAISIAVICFLICAIHPGDARALGKPPQRAPGMAVGSLAPDFNLKDTQGRNVRLSDFRGRKAVMLIFSTTWCPQCRKQVPDNNSVYSRYRNKGLEVFHIDIEEPPDRVTAFIKKYNVQYPVLLDRSGKVGEQYRIVGVPAYVLVDRAGKVVCNPCQSPENTIPSLLQ